MRQVKNPLLHRYWIEFEPNRDVAWPPCWACGVTAYDAADALRLLERGLATIWPDRPLPPLRRITEDVDVSTLDRGHVRPNMGVVIWRGVWFPNLGPEPSGGRGRRTRERVSGGATSSMPRSPGGPPPDRITLAAWAGPEEETRCDYCDRTRGVAGRVHYQEMGGEPAGGDEWEAVACAACYGVLLRFVRGSSGAVEPGWLEAVELEETGAISAPRVAG